MHVIKDLFTFIAVAAVFFVLGLDFDNYLQVPTDVYPASYVTSVSDGAPVDERFISH